MPGLPPYRCHLVEPCALLRRKTDDEEDGGGAATADVKGGDLLRAVHLVAAGGAYHPSTGISAGHAVSLSCVMRRRGDGAFPRGLRGEDQPLLITGKLGEIARALGGEPELMPLGQR